MAFEVSASIGKRECRPSHLTLRIWLVFGRLVVVLTDTITFTAKQKDYSTGRNSWMAVNHCLFVFFLTLLKCYKHLWNTSSSWGLVFKAFFAFFVYLKCNECITSHDYCVKLTQLWVFELSVASGLFTLNRFLEASYFWSLCTP